MPKKRHAVAGIVAATAYIALCTHTILTVRAHQRCEVAGGRYELQQQSFYECLKPGERSKRPDPGIG